ncbi:hypothetical protein D5278_03845 [bacterium 1XD21-13]|nr:hypothetical protein [bacterium 1XD21-13]
MLTFIAHQIRNLIDRPARAAHQHDGFVDPQTGKKILEGHSKLLLHQAAQVCRADADRAGHQVEIHIRVTKMLKKVFLGLRHNRAAFQGRLNLLQRRAIDLRKQGLFASSDHNGTGSTQNLLQAFLHMPPQSSKLLLPLMKYARHILIPIHKEIDGIACLQKLSQDIFKGKLIHAVGNMAVVHAQAQGTVILGGYEHQGRVLPDPHGQKLLLPLALRVRKASLDPVVEKYALEVFSVLLQLIIGQIDKPLPGALQA